MDGGGIDVLTAVGGIGGDPVLSAGAVEHLLVSGAVPVPVQAVLGEGAVEGFALKLGGVGEGADGSEEKCRHGVSF